MVRILKRYQKDIISPQESEWLIQNEERLAVSSKKILELTTSISSFDVEMTYISSRLKKSVEKMENLGESNLSIVEEITATMNQVTEIIGNAVGQFQSLLDSFQVLAKQNAESDRLLNNVSNLKGEVLLDTQDMSQKMDQLVDLTQEVGNIVGAVRSIANQTNLLALNASIEAARAGDAGKGFAVVAQEIGKLSDDTKTNLENMTSFVDKILEATNAGKESVDGVLKSTDDMGEKIDAVSETVSNNIRQLDQVVEGIKELSARMEEIRSSAQEVNTAMESTAEDTEGLIDVTKEISADAGATIKLAHAVSEIDDGLSSSIDMMYEGLVMGRHAISNEELLEVIRKAKQSHTNWLKNLEGIVSKMEITPLQTNPNKCAFGHYYNAIKVNNSLIKEEWSSIRALHREFHSMGDKIIAVVERNDKNSASKMLSETNKISEKLLHILTSIEAKVEKCVKEQVKIFKTDI